MDCFITVVVQIAFGPISLASISGYNMTVELQDGWGQTWASCKQRCVKMAALAMCLGEIIERY